jgi:hypothetical protein
MKFKRSSAPAKSATISLKGNLRNIKSATYEALDQIKLYSQRRRKRIKQTSEWSVLNTNEHKTADC